MKNGKRLTETEIREKLVLWLAFESKITDFRTKAFALEVCKSFDIEKGGTITGIADFRDRFGISPGSVRKYTTTLIKSGEWLINPMPGRQTLYVPHFVL